MTELYVTSRDAGITVALITNGRRESVPPYVVRQQQETQPAAGGARPRQTGGMTAEQFDRIFPLWAAKYPGRVQVAA